MLPTYKHAGPRRCFSKNPRNSPLSTHTPDLQKYLYWRGENNQRGDNYVQVAGTR